ncbi:MAG TPA: hypothetical protein VHU92_24555 [Streptosporangiaceae bacterium]|jgi:hypothetical protein|nr:hypothetical protein [Streptosporangiaceae bacterium]
MDGEVMEVELAVPAADEITATGRLRPGVLPGGRYVTLPRTGQTGHTGQTGTPGTTTA